MTFQMTSDATGRTFSYTSEAAYEAAENWFNRTSKADAILFCEHRGVSVRDGDRLIPDWADVAMHTYALVA